MTGSVFNDERIKCLNSLMKSNRHTFFLGGEGVILRLNFCYSYDITKSRTKISKLESLFFAFRSTTREK